MPDLSHSFEAYFKRATSPLAVLHYLAQQPMYGYEISQAMKRDSGGRFTITVLYPILYRLEEQGYIAVERTEIINNRARSYYTITPSGRDYLAQSLREYGEISAAFLAIIEGCDGE